MSAPMTVKRLLAACAVLVLASPASAHAQDMVPPRPEGWVADGAKLLSAEDVADVGSLVASVHASTGARIAVLTVANAHAVEPKAIAMRALNTWQAGKWSVCLLVVLEPRKLYVQPGDELAHVFTEPVASALCKDVIAPPLKAGRARDAIAAGVKAIAAQIARALPPVPDRASETLVDETKQLGAPAREALEARAAALRRDRRVELVVLAVNDARERDVAAGRDDTYEVPRSAFVKWKLGPRSVLLAIVFRSYGVIHSNGCAVVVPGSELELLDGKTCAAIAKLVGAIPSNYSEEPRAEVLAATLAGVAAIESALAGELVPRAPPPPAGHVRDDARRFRPDELAAIESRCAAIAVTTSAEVTVLADRNLWDEKPDAIAARAFKEWHLPANGVLVVVLADHGEALAFGEALAPRLAERREGITQRIWQQSLDAALDELERALQGIAPAPIPKPPDSPSGEAGSDERSWFTEVVVTALVAAFVIVLTPGLGGRPLRIRALAVVVPATFLGLHLAKASLGACCAFSMLSPAVPVIWLVVRRSACPECRTYLTTTDTKRSPTSRRGRRTLTCSACGWTKTTRHWFGRRQAPYALTEIGADDDGSWEVDDPSDDAPGPSSDYGGDGGGSSSSDWSSGGGDSGGGGGGSSSSGGGGGGSDW